MHALACSSSVISSDLTLTTTAKSFQAQPGPLSGGGCWRSSALPGGEHSFQFGAHAGKKHFWPDARSQVRLRGCLFLLLVGSPAAVCQALQLLG